MITIYAGPSAIDGAPIRAVLTGADGRSSRNRKTGPMAQLWILPADRPVWPAVRAGQDVAVCGDCPRRPAVAGYGRAGCYVARHAWREVASVQRWSSSDPDLDRAAAALAGRLVRLGAYGDPGALPPGIVPQLVEGAKGWTGYTRRWQTRPDLRPYCHASVEHELAAWHAWVAGWRTFRVLQAWDASLPKLERPCPAAAGRTSCDHCRACKGSSGRSVTIREH